MCNLWPTNHIGGPRTPDLLPELRDLAPSGAAETAALVKRCSELLWPESALAPQALWPAAFIPLAPTPDPALGDDLSPSPPHSPTSPCYSPREQLTPLERIELGDDLAGEL